MLGLAIAVASFLAAWRSDEHELSRTRVKNLEQFIRECQAFKIDHGHILNDEYDNELNRFRERFEELVNANNRQVPLFQI
jgi:hypothetical protein